MKILMVSQNFAPELTGIGRYSGEMAAWLAARGHDVQVVAAFPHYPEWHIADAYRGRWHHVEHLEGVTVHRVPVLTPKDGRITTLGRIVLESSFSLSAARWWLPMLFSRERPDVTVTVSPPAQAVVWPWFYSKLRRVPSVVHLQDLQIDAALNLGMLRNRSIGSILRKFEQWSIRNADHVTTISNSMLRRVREKGVAAHRSSLFPNWADLNAIKPTAPDPLVRSSLGAGPNDVLFVYAGNIGQKQGLENVIDAAHSVAHLKNVSVAIVGAGANRSALEAYAARVGTLNVRFHDLVRADALSALLAAADVHLVVQRREAADLVMPSKLTNILAAGRASIVTADPDTELGHVVRTADCGVLVAPDDASALARAMLALANDEQAVRTYGERARRFAEEQLDRDVVLSGFERILEEVVLAS